MAEAQINANQNPPRGGRDRAHSVGGLRDAIQRNPDAYGVVPAFINHNNPEVPPQENLVLRPYPPRAAPRVARDQLPAPPPPPLNEHEQREQARRHRDDIDRQIRYGQIYEMYDRPLEVDEMHEFDRLMTKIRNTQGGALLAIPILASAKRHPYEALMQAREMEQQLPTVEVDHLVSAPTLQSCVRDAMCKLQINPGAGRNIIIEPPKRESYSNVSMHNEKMGADHTNRLKVYWPQCGSPKYKFSGEPGSSIHVDEFLEPRTDAQNILCLSEEDFLHLLMCDLTGDAHSFVTHLRESGYSIEEIYSNLVDRYFDKEAPEEAQEKINALIHHGHKFKNFAEMDAEVHRLAKLASYRARPGDRRTGIRTTCILDAYKAVMPEGMSHSINAEVARTAGLLGRDLTVDEYRNLIRNHATEIDYAWRTGKGKTKFKPKFARNRNNNGGRDTQPKSSKPPPRKDPVPSKPAENKNNKASFKAKTKVNKTSGKSSGSKKQEPNAASVKFNNGNGNGKGKDKSNNKRPRDRPSKCLLCGNADHINTECRIYPPSTSSLTQAMCRTCGYGYHSEAACIMNRLKN